MRIKRVNVNPTKGTTAIDFQTVENDGKDHVDHHLQSSDDPHPRLVRALAALKGDVQAVAELPEDYLDDVRGLTIHRDDDDQEKVTVTFVATKRLEECNAPLVVNTPAVLPGPALLELVQEVLSAAAEYAQGRRAQGDLPIDGPSRAAGEREEREDAEEPAPGRVDEVATARGKKPSKKKAAKESPHYANTPEDDAGQVYECKAPNGELCRVKQDQAGAWWGRVGGKPIASRVTSSREARKLVDEHLSGVGAWKPTVDLGQDGAGAEGTVETPEPARAEDL